MSLSQYIKRHVLFSICLALIGYAIIAFIYIYCPEKIGHNDVIGKKLAFAPIYNKSGSTLHALLGIGYNQVLLIIECIICVFIVIFMHKIVAYYNIFLNLDRWWAYIVDFACAAVLGRLPVNLLGFYTLDYLYISMTRYTYDFFDICLGICVIGILVWCIPISIKYHKYKVSHTKGMKIWEKIKWEIGFGFKIIRESLRPMKIWWNV